MKPCFSKLHQISGLVLLLTTVFFIQESYAKKAEFVLDMVHHNPGEARYQTDYENPAVIKKMGYNGKVFFLFDSPMLAINWESVDPTILPKGTPDRKWVDDKAKEITKKFAACKKLGISVYAMSDLILFPKRLIAKYKIEETFGDPQNPLTRKLLKAQIDAMFKQFPDFDGLVVRIGETYLEDAPYHKGSIKNRTNAKTTIIPLIKLLREEICVKRNKKLIFRTWRAFDTNVKRYNEVSAAIEPHTNLVISIKHCEGDFHRANPFSKVIGMGRHRQLIEVQCAREYEGKGAYPNYVINGVIEGFEEYKTMPKDQINSLRKWTEKKPDLFGGIWTWTRGGGWRGPYIKNEMWCNLNAWVVAQWANDTTKSEESVFRRYATEQLHLKGKDVDAFRKLCLLSTEAVVRGRNSTFGDMNPWWTRDQGIGWPRYTKTVDYVRNLKQKDESIAKWKEIVSLAKSINWADEETKTYAIGSSYYGLHLYEIYRAIINIDYAKMKNDKAGMKKWIKEYDAAWAAYSALPSQYPNLATLYSKIYNLHIRNNADETIQALRKEIEK